MNFCVYSYKHVKSICVHVILYIKLLTVIISWNSFLVE